MLHRRNTKLYHLAPEPRLDPVVAKRSREPQRFVAQELEHVPVEIIRLQPLVIAHDDQRRRFAATPGTRTCGKMLLRSRSTTGK